MATIYGTNRADELYDSSGDDKIYGYGGNDQITSFAGRDVIAAGAGDDYVDGSGSSDNSKIFGDDGNDTLTNFPGGDDIGPSGWIYGGNGNDTINANGTLSGDAGNDTLTGGWEHSNTLLGGAGDDKLYGQGTLNGGSGKDMLENNVDGGKDTKMTGGSQADQFHVSLDDGAYEYRPMTKVTITDFHHSEGDKLQVHSMHLNGESPYFGYYQDTGVDLFRLYDNDRHGHYDGVIRIGDYATSKSADGDLQLHLYGALVELDGVRSLSTSDWIH